MKGDLQKLGEDVDPSIDSISKIQTQILNLTHGKVNIFEDDGSFKSTYEIMKEISQIYDHLSDPEQADLLETIAGKNRSNEVAALVQNWEQVEKAFDAATNSGGTAQEEQEVYMESIQGHIDQLKSTWQSLSSDTLDRGFITGALSGATEFLSVLDKIVSTLGTMPTLIGGIAAALSFKNVGEPIKFHF